MFLIHLALVVAIEASITGRARWMAGTAYPIGSPMAHWESVVEGGTRPTAGGMALRALPIEMVSRPVPRVTADAIRRTCDSMIETGGAPGTGIMAGRTLPIKVVG